MDDPKFLLSYFERIVVSHMKKIGNRVAYSLGPHLTYIDIYAKLVDNMIKLYNIF